MTYEEIVDSYIRDCRPDASAEMGTFRRLASLTDAIAHAALCRRFPDGKRHSHQRRISAANLDAAERRLQSADEAIGAAADFEALHRTADMAIGKNQGLGKLAVYDIAHRIGAFLGIEPTLVYLHCGTREGARALGFTGKTLDPARLPATFSRLSPAEIEDCLCIYKRELHDPQSRPRPQGPSCCAGADRPRPRPC